MNPLHGGGTVLDVRIFFKIFFSHVSKVFPSAKFYAWAHYNEVANASHATLTQFLSKHVNYIVYSTRGSFILKVYLHKFLLVVIATRLN